VKTLFCIIPKTYNSSTDVIAFSRQIQNLKVGLPQNDDKAFYRAYPLKILTSRTG